MRTRVIVALFAAGALGMLAVGSYATADSGKRNVSTGPMSGYLEVPSISTVASGSFEAEIDDAAREIQWELTYRDLEAAVTQAHIHFGQRWVASGISLWFCSNLASPPTPPGVPPCPAPPATLTGTFGPDDVTGPTSQGIAPGEFDEIVAAIRAGRAYANVHSTKFPPGEVRGQINDDNQRDD